MLPAATGTDGTYRFSLPPGNYRLTFEYPGYKIVEIPAATISGPWTVVQNCEARGGRANPKQYNRRAGSEAGTDPSNNPTEPSLEDLGITPAQAKGSAQAQALLDRRTHMLKVHQRLGLITIAPFAATLITSAFAGGKQTSTHRP